MRREELFLRDIVEAADAVAGFLAEQDRESFTRDDLVRSAVVYKLVIIGEAANRLSGELRTRHPEIPWPDIVGLRNIAAHRYFGVNWSIVWDTAKSDVPELRANVATILAAEFPDTT